RRRHTRWPRDWSSDVCSSDLNGMGIPKDEQRSIYEQFTRGRAALDGSKPGVGLGLAFVRTIVKGNRGKLDLASRPGETAFRIRQIGRASCRERVEVAVVG